jgi:hypothetical protein
MPTVVVYRDGKKVAEHIASETGTASFSKVWVWYAALSCSVLSCAAWYPIFTSLSPAVMALHTSLLAGEGDCAAGFVLKRCSLKGVYSATSLLHVSRSEQSIDQMERLLEEQGDREELRGLILVVS